MKPFHPSGLSSFLGRLALVVKVSLIFLAVSSFATDGDTERSRYGNWSRAVADGMDPGTPFIVLSTSSIDGHLWAECGYQYLAIKGSVVLHGTKAPNSDLSPFVTYELATEDKAKWKSIGKFTESKHSMTLEVSPTNPRVLLRVDMEPFRSSIGKVRWARLVLENGDAAVFTVDDLLPAGNSPDAGAGSFKQDVEDLDPMRFGSSFELVHVVSFSNRLVGDFVFIAGLKGASAEIKGTKTADGDLWPSVTLQASNSDHDWETLATSADRGAVTSLEVMSQNALIPLRVVLDAYKRAFGRFKYGKIIFSDGKFAVFEIADLKPH